MSFLKILGIAALGSTFLTVAIMLLLAMPFFLWQLFTSDETNVQLPGWLDSHFFNIAVVLWVIFSVAFLVVGLCGAFT